MSIPQRRLLIRVYGDSLSLPRHSTGIEYHDTYPERLREEIERCQAPRVSVYNRSLGGATISDLYAQYLRDSAYFGGKTEQWIIIQCGVVDCAPRPVSMPVRKLISRLPVPLKWLAIKLIHHSRPFLLRFGCSFRATSLPHFESIFSAWLKHAAEHCSRVFVVNIAPTVAEVEAHSPGFTSSIVEYNLAINRLVRNSSLIALIDVFQAISRAGDVAACIDRSDGHHLTLAGHRLYATLVASQAVARKNSCLW